MSSKFKKLADTRLSDALVQVREALPTSSKGVKKTVTMLGSTAAAGEGESGSTIGLSHPTDAELVVINGYTKSPKTAEQLFVLPTMSANDMIDRDLDKFPTKTIHGFANLKGAQGANGKAFMVGHDYTKLPIGRIFETGTKSVEIEGQADKVTFLTNKVYVPNTPQYADYLESVDFGVNWAVSVGVMLEGVLCSVVEEGATPDHQMTGWGFCEKGHVKGYSYDASSDEEDDWGWPEPVNDTAKNAQLCIGLMDGAKDFYELSQVFLGAQFDAQLADKNPALAGVIKAAGLGKRLPVIGLTAKEAEDIPMPVHIAQVDAAMAAGAELEDDGRTRWVDPDGLVWVLEPGASEAVCLGKSDEDETEEVDDGEGQSEQGDEAPESLGEDSGELAEAGSGRLHDSEGLDSAGDNADPGEVAVAASATHKASGDIGDSVACANCDHLGSMHNDTKKGDNTGACNAASCDCTAMSKSVSAADVVGKLIAFKAPAELVDAVRGFASGDPADHALKTAVTQLNEAHKTILALRPKAAMGDLHLSSVKSDAIDWYVRANATPGEPKKGVSVTVIQKLLDLAGDDLEVIDSLIEQYKTIAQERFPATVRRSSIPVDPHPGADKAIEDAAGETHLSAETASTVGRLHK